MIEELKTATGRMRGLEEFMEVGFYVNSPVLPVSVLGATTLLWLEEFSRRRIELYVSCGMKRTTIFWSKVLLGQLWVLLGMIIFIAGLYWQGSRLFQSGGLLLLLSQLGPAIALYTGMAFLLSSLGTVSGIWFRKKIMAIFLPVAFALLWEFWREPFGEMRIYQVVFYHDWSMAFRLTGIMIVLSVFFYGMGYWLMCVRGIDLC